ncbi:aerolysin family beta-barrel pore-forming toxin [Shewanella sp.]|uniref:aerolysin family beta-barrel pore-forming toxin n=1 Tax=Shewanella sp. TaxID=50422 RepID=UPI001EB2785A|nr:aerolysin family beta-barrel pore-forming toxin [Shewanella sp.]NRB22405.1 aerolysin family beta-barrel pore-forming toxin [Shewanella sp.]
MKTSGAMLASFLTMACFPGLAVANTLAPIYPDQLKLFELGSEICGESYRPVTRDEAQSVKSAIVGKMEKWQTSALAEHWLIMGPGYYGEIKRGTADSTWCYPNNIGSDEIPVLSTHSIPTGDEVDIQWRLVHDRDYFVKPVSYLAHLLGYAWVGGNHSDYVGEDMDIFREADSWRIQGNDQGRCSGYRCGDKTSIEVSNFAFSLNSTGFSHGDITESGKQLIKVITANAVNHEDTPQQVVVSLNYDTTSHWTKTDTYGFSEKVTTKNKFKWPLVGETELSIEIAADQSWSSEKGGTETNSVTIQASPIVPANSITPIKISIYKSSISYPYEYDVDISYDLNITGFLRWGGNAWHTHPTNRPTKSHTFTIGRWKNHANSINYQWDKRYIPGEIRWWDWSSTIEEYGYSTMKSILSQVIRPIKSSVSGDFYAENQFAGDIEIGYPKDNRMSSFYAVERGVELRDQNFSADEMTNLGLENVELSVTRVVQP